MLDPERHVYRSFHLDTNRINARGRLENVNHLERWRDAGVILLQMSETAQQEARAGRGASGRARKTTEFIFTLTCGLTPAEEQQMAGIEHILFPNGARSPSERNDVEIVFNAWKYSAILVTADGGSRRQPGGILGNRDALASIGVTVMTDDEAVALVERLIEERDQRLRRHQKEFGSPLPVWVGRD